MSAGPERPESPVSSASRRTSRRNIARERGHTRSLRPFGGLGSFGFFALFALIAGLMALPAGAQAKDDSQVGSGGESLEGAVLEEMGVETTDDAARFTAASAKDSQPETQVNVMKTGDSGDWAFGSAVIEAPKKKGHYPQGWLFVAEENDSGEGWDVGLEGSGDFQDLASKAPEDVLSKDEKETFAAQTTREASAKKSGPVRTGLSLPWRKGLVWNFTGGPHGWNTGYDRPYSSMDFSGPSPNNQRVRAAGPGNIYTMCSNRRGWIRIYHRSGFTSNYYHLRQNVKLKQGSNVARGRIIGLTGEDVSCGGAAYGRHVHFSLLRGDKFIPVNNRTIGGWTFHQAKAYEGYAKHKKVRRNPGTKIQNFGGNG